MILGLGEASFGFFAFKIKRVTHSGIIKILKTSTKYEKRPCQYKD